MYLVLMLCILALNSLQGEAKFKSLHCNVNEVDYLEVTLCKLKAINRYKNSASIHFKLKQEINKATVRLEFFKRANGWKPFLYNISTNLCDFLNNKNNLIIGIFYAYSRPHLAQNYTCPFKKNEVIEMNNFELDMNQFRNRFPIETGEYAAHISFIHRQKVIVTFIFTVEYANYREI
ncbi:uncharacterized protein LOC108024342 [Drosophila biarmipes]|uniref:uncharacterized protein LOC108024342 n=1 Tax=Drosophila biarmipes TaxID=125945 RepID=UPI0007E7BDC7|nr:uncharacterized protein LOC108024342 [Drosophila biarmipes]